MKRYMYFIIVLILVIFTLNGCAQVNNINNNSLELNELNYDDIKDKLIRFHVIANSDTEEDQNLKLKVRDKVVEALSEKLKGVESLEEAEEILEDNIEYVNEIARQVITSNNYDYEVNTMLSYENFPNKVYGDYIFPQGNYEAYRVIIGSGQGQNWWCVMFPSLCFVDESKSDVDSTKLKEEIENIEPKEDKEENKVEKYKNIMQQLKKTLNTNGWDGRWYKRAFMDDGNILGSMANDECRIDSIAQSWSTISNAGDNDKKYISMESLENHLIDRENGIIKLLDPPFEKGKLEPGYIKAYLPGVRENGGQYTHAAVWVIIAETILGFGDKATELYRMINPIEHSRTMDAAKKYKVEPYVIPADIYGANNLAGHGGWTWYTGSSSWYYKAGIEFILGLKIKNEIMSIEPCIPKDWKEYNIQYKWKNSIYNIVVKNPNGKNTGVTKVIVNGKEIETNESNNEKGLIKLEDNGIFNIEVWM